MMVEIDLFREITRRICGSLDFKEALQDTYLYLKHILTLDAIFITRYEYEHRRARLIAGAHDEAGFLLDEDLVLSEDAWGVIHKWLLASRQANIPWIRDHTHPINLEILNFIGDYIPREKRHYIKQFSSLTCALKVKQTIIGNLTFCASGDFRYTDAHAEIIREINEPFAIALSNALSYMDLMINHKALQRDAQKMSGDVMIGAEGGLREVKQLIERVAPTESHVFLLGETGVGKEVVATEIHKASRRSEGPFIRLNCGAIADSLIDSELFGHEKGAFTGASQTTRGRFERADQGTLFLDEIAELSPAAQVKLLRVIQSGEFERVGGAKAMHTDVRIIAATHRDLNTMILENTFRADLWYRLNVFPIHIPPLRERKADIPDLVSYLVRRKAQEMNLNVIPQPSEKTLRALQDYQWPGNIRELQNLIERALILSKGMRLEFPELHPPPGTVQNSVQDGWLKPLTLRELEREHIMRVLKSVRGKISGKDGAAQLLDIHPNTLRSRMEKLNIPYAVGKV